MTRSLSKNRSRLFQPFGFLAGVIVTVALVIAWRFYSPEERPNVILLFDDFTCRTFTIFYDPSLDGLPKRSAVRIPSGAPQAIRVPDSPVSFSFWDIDGNGAYKTELQIGTFGPPEARVGYSTLAIGAELPCGREELRDEVMERSTSLFDRTKILLPN